MAAAEESNNSTNYTTSSSTLTLPDGHVLYTKTWHPLRTPPRARLIFLHGFSDHCNFYATLFAQLASPAHAIQVHSFDQRGWGRSAPEKAQRGVTGGTATVLADVEAFARDVLAQQQSRGEEEVAVPLFLMGHSMGGGIALHFAARAPADLRARFRGVLAESPLVALHASARPAALTVALGRAAARILPRFQLVQTLAADKLCRDPAVVRAWRRDALCHDTGTLEGLAGMLDRAAELEDGSVVLADGVGAGGEGGRTRVWIGFGSGDAILSEPACRRWFERCAVRDKEYRLYEGWYHKLHEEPGEDKLVFARDVAKWILDRSGPLDSFDAVTGKPKL